MALGFEARGLHYVEHPASGALDGEAGKFAFGQFFITVTASDRFQVSCHRVIALARRVHGGGALA
jgi:hypothetical protein